MTGKELVNKYCKSINALFEENTFDLNVKFSNKQVPTYHTSGSKRTILLPDSIENLVFDKSNLNIEYLTLIALGHETAHYLNNHNKINDKTLDKGLELWADFFGIKILFTLFLHDEFFKHRYSFFDDPNGLIKNYFNGICSVYEYYYSNSNGNYPSKELRIQVALSASTSVFSYFTNELCNKYSILAVKEFSENPNFDIDKYEDTQKEFHKVYPEILEAHSQIIGNDQFISKNMKKEFLKYITTAYSK